LKKTIVIAGLGLIGGSIAKSIVLSADNHVIGYDVSEEVMNYALENGIINEAATEFQKDAVRADFIILAAPITQTIYLLKELNGLTFNKKVIVSDVSSVKSNVMRIADTLTNKHITFIGGHPMAGSHKKGIQAARGHLFENAIYVLTPSIYANSEDTYLLQNLLVNTKSKFVILNQTEHDEMTGVVSHFPHLIASSLVHQARKWNDMHSFLPNLAAGGFRDITRIASSNPTMWQDIFYHNRYKMSHLLEEWIKEMHYLKNLLDDNNKDEMITYLNEAKQFRDGLGVSDKGAIPSFYDIYVDIRDQAGALATVTQLLASYRISINNIQILEIREGINGALRLSFSSEEAQKKSDQVLQANGYETMIEK
jgi:prephenate dehydrogenase